MNIICENTKCKYCKHSYTGCYICYTDKLIKINSKGKCTTYEKDTPQNIKLAKSNKNKVK